MTLTHPTRPLSPHQAGLGTATARTVAAVGTLSPRFLVGQPPGEYSPGLGAKPATPAPRLSAQFVSMKRTSCALRVSISSGPIPTLSVGPTIFCRLNPCPENLADPKKSAAVRIAVVLFGDFVKVPGGIFCDRSVVGCIILFAFLRTVNVSAAHSIRCSGSGAAMGVSTGQRTTAWFRRGPRPRPPRNRGRTQMVRTPMPVGCP